MGQGAPDYFTPPPRTSGLAVTSLVLGILSLPLLCFWPLSIPSATLAILFGVLARKRVAQEGLEGEGMATAGVVCGSVTVGIFAMIFLATVVGLSILWQGFKPVRGMFAQMHRANRQWLFEDPEWLQLAETWNPPPERAGVEQMFPMRVGLFSRTSHDDEEAVVMRQEIGDLGRHATYTSASGTMEVYVSRKTAPEKDALFDFVVTKSRSAKHSSRLTSRRRSTKTERLMYSIRPPKERGILWWNEGWLLMVKTADDLAPKSFLM